MTDLKLLQCSTGSSSSPLSTLPHNTPGPPISTTSSIHNPFHISQGKFHTCSVPPSCIYKEVSESSPVFCPYLSLSSVSSGPSSHVRLHFEAILEPTSFISPSTSISLLAPFPTHIHLLSPTPLRSPPCSQSLSLKTHIFKSADTKTDTGAQSRHTSCQSFEPSPTNFKLQSVIPTTSSE